MNNKKWMLIIAKCHWVVSIHLPWLANLYAPITLQWLGLICAPSPFTRLFHRTYLSQPSLCPSSYNIIGLFRSTVLRVMSPTRFLCATMMGLSFGGFDPPPPGSNSTWYAPITLQRLVWYVPHLSFTRLFHRTYLSHPFFWCAHLPIISSGCFDQPSFGLWARRASSAPRWWGCHLAVSIHLLQNWLALLPSCSND